MEDHHLHNFFGANLSIVSMVWDMLVANGLRPEKSRPKHVLWALYFLKVYPKQSPGCLVVGASTGTVDPRTMRKCMWQFIENISNLTDKVVSLFVQPLPHRPPPSHAHPHPLSSSPSPQIIFESRLGADDVGNNCITTIDGPGFWIPQQGAAERGNTFAFHKYVGKSSLRYKLLGVDILAGNSVWIQGRYLAGKYNNIKIFIVSYATTLSQASAWRWIMDVSGTR